jgi:hypothetical protein
VTPKEFSKMLKKALAGERVFDSFRAPPPKRAADRGDARMQAARKMKKIQNSR